MDIHFNSENNEYHLKREDGEYVLRKGKVNGERFKVVGRYKRLESVLDQALWLEMEDSTAHSFADVYAAIEEAKEFIRGVASKIEETALKQGLYGLAEHV